MAMAGCVQTSHCRVLHPPDAPSLLRIHAVFLPLTRVSDFSGSWLHAVMRDRLVSCASPPAHFAPPREPSAAFSWAAGPYAPAPNASDEHELLFLPLESSFNARGAATRLEPRGALRLVPCGAPSAAHAAAALGATAWHGERRGALTLRRVMAGLSRRARLVVSLSTTPDVTVEVLENAFEFVAAQGFAGGRRRMLTLHYRAGLIPRWAGGVAGAELGTPQLFWSRLWRALSWEASQRSSRRCAAPRHGGGAARNASFLLLGGDAHFGRQYVLKELHRHGLLQRALWSLSTPAECRGARPQAPDGRHHEQLPVPKENEEGWEDFCALFPKSLDIKLLGEASVNEPPKDTTFPPAYLYEQTRFSVVFESTITGEPENYTAFLTEKIMKPIYAGHPFVILCGARDAWDVALALGFRSFEPIIPTTQLPLFDGAQEELQGGKCGVRPQDAHAVALELRRMLDAPPHAWAEAEAAAEFNRHHLICGGFHSRLLQLEREVLDFIRGEGRWATSSPVPPPPAPLSHEGQFTAPVQAGAVVTMMPEGRPRGSVRTFSARGDAGGPLARRSKGGGRGGSRRAEAEPGKASSQLAVREDLLAGTLRHADELEALVQKHIVASKAQVADLKRLQASIRALRGRRGGTSGQLAGGAQLPAPSGATKSRVEGVLSSFRRPHLQLCSNHSKAMLRYLQTLRDERPHNAIILREGAGGSGFGTALQEKANVLLLGMITQRPVYITPVPRELNDNPRVAFNSGGVLLAPEPRAVEASLLVNRVPEQAQAFTDEAACRQAVSEASLRFPYQCRQVAGKWEMQLDDGDAPKIVDQNKHWWNRFEHKVEKTPLDRIFPQRASFVFRSPSVVGAMIPDFLRADPVFSGSRELAELSDLSSEWSGPGCLVRFLIGSVAPKVVRALVRALKPCHEHDCALVGLHVRRGDSAMSRECKTCVDQADPDVGREDRVETDRVATTINLLNNSLPELREAWNRRVFVFMASDTDWATQRAREVMGANNVLLVEGRPIHSTQVSSKDREAASVKVAADFVGLAISDVLFSIGQSSFSGNAAAMSFAPERVGANSLHAEMPKGPILSQDQLERVRQTFISTQPRATTQ